MCDPTSGECNQTCTTSADCLAGFLCDQAIKACVRPDAPPGSADGASSSGGCGCSSPGDDGHSAAGALALLLPIVLRRRRRRTAG
jgi:MYXO-CTERM domain-containing protein